MPRPWTREDAILCMAVHMDRPPRMQLPPMPERERLASVLRRDVSEVTAHLWEFVRLERDEAIEGWDARVWRTFRDDPVALWEAADAVVAARQQLPRFLRRFRTGNNP